MPSSEEDAAVRRTLELLRQKTAEKHAKKRDQVSSAKPPVSAASKLIVSHRTK
jgi:hypothetical protein